jgi:hypothetical protein
MKRITARMEEQHNETMAMMLGSQSTNNCANHTQYIANNDF